MITHPDKRIIVGCFGAPHGVRGWVKLNSYTEPFDNLLDYLPWEMEVAPNQWQNVPLEKTQVTHNSLLIKLNAVDDRNAAQLLTHRRISIYRSQLPAPEEHSHYWSDLENFTVTSQDGKILGKVKSFFNTGSNDVMIVEGGEKRLLVPYIKPFLIEVSIENKTIVVDMEFDE